MSTLIIIALIAGGLILFAIEVFLIPGISVAGLSAACCILFAIYYAFANVGFMAGWITVGASAAGVAMVTAWFMRSKTVDRLALKKTLNFKPEPLKGLDLKPGDTGVSVTRLTLIGNADFNGKIIEVQSADGFIDSGFRPTMISTPFTQMLAHKLRTECQAIVVGRVTDERDHPQLNIRHWSGPAPRRMVLSHSHDIDAILAECRADSLQSLLVEGGAATHRAFIERGLWDEIRVETAPLALHRGTRAATLPDWA